MADRKNVFISSTVDDLKKYRSKAEQTILRLGHHPMFEPFSPSNHNALQNCYDAIQQADLFVGIYAHRYGYIPKAELTYTTREGIVQHADGEKSITYWEYVWARERGITQYLLILADKTETGHPVRWPAKFIDSDFKKELLDRFKTRIKEENVIQFFYSPESLVSQLALALAAERREVAPPPSRPWHNRATVRLGLVVLLLLLAAGLFYVLCPKDGAPGLAAIVTFPLTELDLSAQQECDPQQFAIRGLAAGGPSVWLATSCGLARYDPAQTPAFALIPDVKDDLFKVDTDQTGQRVWFIVNALPGQTPEVGLYEVGAAHNPKMLPPVFQGQPLPAVNRLTSILVLDNGDVVLGVAGKGLAIYRASGQWDSILPLSPGVPDIITKIVAARHQLSLDLWMTSQTLLYRWHANGWEYVNAAETNQSVANANDLVFDALGNLWVATRQGLAVKSGNLWFKCTAQNSYLPAGQGLALGTSEDGRVVWVVTSQGIARVEVGETLSTRCRDWNWHVWQKKTGTQGIWNPEPLGLLAAVSEETSTPAGGVTLWLVGSSPTQLERMQLAPRD